MQGKFFSQFRVAVLSFLFLCATTAQAEVHYLFMPDDSWQPAIEKILKDVDQNLGTEWKPQLSLVVAFNPDVEVSFDFHKKAIFLGQQDQPSISHEYGHFLLDQYMEKNSPAWRYFFFRLLTLRGKMVSESIGYFESEVTKLEGAIEDFKANPNAGDIVKNLEKALGETRHNLGIAKQVLVEEGTYGDSFGGMGTFRALEPYHELFADALTVLPQGDWQMMEKTSRKLLKMRGETLLVPKGATEDLIQKHRRFQKGLSLDTYNFQDWEKKSSHSQFPIVKSYLRQLVEVQGVSPGKVVSALGKGILEEFDAFASGQWDQSESSLKERNQRLLEKIKKHLAK